MARVTTTKAIASRKSWQERAETWRDKIETSKIINRFQEFVMGAVAPKGCAVLPIEPTTEMLTAAGLDLEAYEALLKAAPESAPVVMTPAQVKAGQVLLDRVMPTLSASEIVRKDVPVNPEQLIQQLRERYGNDFADKVAKDYTPQETHEAPETTQ